MSWARSALERNAAFEVVAADEQSRTFTVRMKDTGELRVVRADQLIAGVTAPATGSASAKAAPQAGPAAPAGPAASAEPLGAETGAARADEAAVPEPSSTEPARPAESAPARARVEAPGGGRVLKSGPGYSIKASAAPAPAAGGRLRDTAVTSAAIERRHEPIVCQGQRLLHIDNRNLEFDGDAVSAQDGCEIHITNSHISATGVGVSARAANVHIDNSLIEGDAAAIDASEGAQVYATSTRFRGLSRRADSASFHDLGGNIWN
ncbi:MAG: hypothetical protein AUH10_12215 [Gammaproteobacteria bacterium 13_2_20CM_66_19]|nr:MAG: hypothetical protein AUH10_12215 [Gammaproteobacteria bacterium 13_2_20CM_66_19]